MQYRLNLIEGFLAKTGLDLSMGESVKHQAKPICKASSGPAQPDAPMPGST
jgi:hypothetical protein